jgi:hypothetical protein
MYRLHIGEFPKLVRDEKHFIYLNYFEVAKLLNAPDAKKVAEQLFDNTTPHPMED